MTAEVGKKKKRRGGHRLYLAGILPGVDASLEHYIVERKAELAKWKHTLNEQLEKIAPLDLQILALMGDDEKVTEDLNLTEDLSLTHHGVRTRLQALRKFMCVSLYLHHFGVLQVLRCI